MTNEEKANDIAQLADYTHHYRDIEIAFNSAMKMAEWKDEQHKINWKKVAKKWYSKAKKSDECFSNRIDYTKTLHFELNKRDLEISNLNDEIATLKRKLSKYEEI